ncbi:arginine--tRNA ligase [Ornithobacterium rhinotracheale]|uniref:Arginine--tRNA ligase n=2 Tax=Ornithobacterium rhinotracheale TaxID=28251 RepID=I3ZXP6_ORNRL|nr:arginine--tRNA ligase [Ornithobacterium rhinotracheale]AFL96480.1 arginyl-tRNA synthetase [Ornithobacterium rhinotracheale DSM 15997]AIP98687.1 arginyl-tRNA synthetase [Ornithobacterium rhinotracheale ORT-UMN 88]KGB67672.1 arginyl-tRNA synthetase [Ornithobacterium rhinotracheale H06-030791]MCK0194808.1 arginine--tRNA ligase [Ornithobacterium rhinotracheale]MCK0200725.1 arginine--tRNA ligase [Ornithobacterium rhinotracheale]
MNIKQHIAEIILDTLKEKFQLSPESVEIQVTRKEFEGDYTLVVFPLVRLLKTKPEQAGEMIGEALMEKNLFSGYNVVKGFLNLVLSEKFFAEYLQQLTEGEKAPAIQQKLMVEYSSPNTNKPLHLGHIRNNLLGYSVAEILKAAGNEVIKTQIVNDRGIHICKSMLAWQKFGNGETPKSANIKGDHLVGKYYVAFDQAYRAEIKDLVEQGVSEEEAKKKAPIFLEAQEMLRKWEANDPEVRTLWATMNDWVYKGFDETYERLGVNFDEVQHESETYLLGKDLVNQGLEKGVFFKKEDGSVWIDLTSEGLDEKLVLRADGTSVYITQDLGTAVERFKNYNIDGLTYVVGNEQDYHFKVLFLILKKLGFDWADQLHHLSYGMVDLPDGKMKSREGTVVDADDLMDEMKQTAKDIAAEAGKLDGLSEEEKEELYEIIGLGALKYYILKVDPKKRILFNPKESIDFNGNTGPFIQYAYVRIQSVLRREQPQSVDMSEYKFSTIEKDLLKAINEYNETVQKAAQELSPALIANYVYDLVKQFNSFYQNHSILNADTDLQKQVRLHLAEQVAVKIKKSLNLLGIKVPQRM